ncbi:MAG: indoleacetate decarboxylase [Candidatus Riflebacteria bacterium]|nr:indoleacetate decarboxylase [Candidatus Riflebacteria bacterium]
MKNQNLSVSKNVDNMIQSQQTPTWPPASLNKEGYESFEVKKQPTTKRTKALKQAFLDSQVLIDPEFSNLFTEGWKLFDGQPFLIRKAKALKHALSKMTPVINEHELLVTQKTRYTRGAVPYTNYSQKFFKHLFEGSDKEKGDESTIAQGGGFASQGKKEVRQMGIFGIHEEHIPLLLKDCEYWDGRCIEDVSDDFMKDNYPDHGFLKKCFDSFIFPPSVVSIMEGRWIPAYDMVIERGIEDIINECSEKIKKTKLQGWEPSEQVIFWRSVIIALEGALIWVSNYQKKAVEMSKQHPDETRRNELREIADILERVPAKPARNFKEALQAAWITHMLIQIECPVVGLSPGRWGQILYPYYKKDIDSGALTDANVHELLEVMRFKFECVEFVSPRSWAALASMNLFQHLVVGGLTPEGKSAENRLEHLMLDAGMTYETCQPTMGILVDPKTSEEMLLKAAECTKTGTGYPAWFNNQAAIQHLLYTHQEEKITLEDARMCGLGGCVELQMQGNCHGICHPAFINQLKILECILNSGKDPRTNIQVFDDPGDIDSYDKLWEAWKIAQKKVVQCYEDYWTYVMACHRHGQSLVFGSAFLNDCIKNGKDLDHNGARYNKTVTILCSGNVNVANSFAALKKCVYEGNKYSIKDACEAMNSNFGFKRMDQDGKYSFLQQEKVSEKWAEMYHDFLDAPKYGNDDNYVDDIFVKVWDVYNESVTSQKSYLGLNWVSAALSISSHGPFGRVTGATPDGRLAGVTLADAIQSPFPGTDVNGPLAMLRSAAKLDPVKMRSVQLNMKIHPTAVKGVDGSRKLCSMIKNYFEIGGYHIQFNIVDSRMLREAQKNPRGYRDLIVRVAGFSAYWVELSKAIQDEIIVRTEYEEIRESLA